MSVWQFIGMTVGVLTWARSKPSLFLWSASKEKRTRKALSAKSCGSSERIQERKHITIEIPWSKKEHIPKGVVRFPLGGFKALRLCFFRGSSLADSFNTPIYWATFCSIGYSYSVEACHGSSKNFCFNPHKVKVCWLPWWYQANPSTSCSRR